MLLETILWIVMLVALGGATLYSAATLWVDGSRIMPVLLAIFIGSAIALLVLEPHSTTVIYVVIPNGT